MAVSCRCAAIALALLVTGFAGAQDAEEPMGWADRVRERVSFGALVEMEWAQEFATGDGQKAEFQFSPELDVELPGDLDLTLIGRFRTELLDELEPGDPSQPEIAGPSRRLIVGDRVEFELREAYIDADIGDAYLRVGKQQIVWGKADGLKVLDVVNPQDFREFILDDFEDSRIPLWSVNLEVPIREVTAQVVWVPDTTTHRIPRDGAAFRLTSGQPNRPAGFRVNINDPERPSRFFADSDVGVRLSTFWKGWDLTLNYLYRYDDFPVTERRVGFAGLRPTITVDPMFDRVHLIGGTFSNAFGNLTLRGELAYSVGKLYSTNDFLDRDGLVESDQFEYVLGFDWFGFSDWFLSFQMFQNIVVEDPAGLVRDRVDTNITALIRRNFRNETITFDTIILHNINDNDGIIRPKISYDIRDNMTVWAGIDFFYGTENGVFGQFDRNDRFVVGAEIGL